MLCYSCIKSLFACHLFLFPDTNFYPGRFYYWCDQLSRRNLSKIRFHKWMKEKINWIFFNRNAFGLSRLFGICLLFFFFSYWSFRQYLLPVVNVKMHDLRQGPISLFHISLILCFGCYPWYIDTCLCPCLCRYVPCFFTYPYGETYKLYIYLTLNFATQSFFS